MNRFLRRKFINLQRRMRAQYCYHHSRKQHNLLAGIEGCIVTLCYDVEGDYSGPGRQQFCLDGLYQILAIEESCGIKSTYNCVGKLLADSPEIVTALKGNGHEIASHSYRHSIMPALAKRNMEEDIHRFRDLLAEHNLSLAGFRSPQSLWNFTLMNVLFDEGLSWSAENGPETYPYILRQRGHRKLFRLPIKDTDWRYESDNATPAEMLAQWQGVVERAKGDGKYAAIGFHPWVLAKNGRLSAYRDFVQWLAELPHVRTLAFRDVVTLIAGGGQSSGTDSS